MARAGPLCCRESECIRVNPQFLKLGVRGSNAAAALSVDDISVRWTDEIARVDICLTMNVHWLGLAPRCV